MAFDSQTQVANWLQVHSGEAVQAIVDTSNQQYTSPAVANAIVAMQPRSCPDAQHWAADLHSIGHSGQKKTPKLTAPVEDSTCRPSRHKLPALRLARGVSLPANPQVRRHPLPARLRVPPTCHGSAAALVHHLECAVVCAHASSCCCPLPCKL